LLRQEKQQLVFFCSLQVSMHSCQICGNEIDSRTVCCPYCGSAQDNANRDQFKSSRKTFFQKTINLEQGLPTVKQALNRLQQEMVTATMEQITVLTLIHGYGSSGKGGAIRLECRKNLEYLLSRGEIGMVVFGEDFSHRHPSVKQLLRRFPELSHHSHLNIRNKGITLVVLS